MNDFQINLVKATAKRNGQSELEKYSSGSVGAYRGDLDLKTTLILLYCNFLHGDVVLKTHGKPSIFVKILLKLGIAKAIYSYRDPRDVMLSILDHGARTRQKLADKGEKIEGQGGFRNIYKPEDAVELVSQEIDIWREWKNTGGVLLIKYEDFINEKRTHFKAMATYLGYDRDSKALDTLLDKYEDFRSRNFNVGKSDRHKSDKKECGLKSLFSRFKKDLEDMEYSYN